MGGLEKEGRESGFGGQLPSGRAWLARWTLAGGYGKQPFAAEEAGHASPEKPLRGSKIVKREQTNIANSHYLQ